MDSGIGQKQYSECLPNAFNDASSIKDGVGICEARASSSDPRIVELVAAVLDWLHQRPGCTRRLRSIAKEFKGEMNEQL